MSVWCVLLTHSGKSLVSGPEISVVQEVVTQLKGKVHLQGRPWVWHRQGQQAGGRSRKTLILEYKKENAKIIKGVNTTALNDDTHSKKDLSFY